jgi:hypothetical protein
MNTYRVAQLMRPLALLAPPAAIVAGYGMQSFVVCGVILLAYGALGWSLRCKVCTSSIYFDKQRPWRTLLAKPHRQCTTCGSLFE